MKGFRTLARTIRTGCINFVRSLWLALAAMAIMIITLTIILFSIVANATFGHTVDQIAAQVDISVFLQDSVTDAQAQQFVKDIKKQPDVAKVDYLTKAQAQQAFIDQNSGNETLQTALVETGNPIPATIHVYPKNLNDIGGVNKFLTQKQYQDLQTSDSPSYNGDRKKAIDNITHATNILRRVGIGAVIVFALVSVMIIFNTIQMAIFNRRDEIQIMRLLGATTWFIRGPFVVEAVIYGLLSAAISTLLINAVFATASGALQATSFGLLDIGYSQQFFQGHYWELLGLQLALGVVIGAGSSIIATRRYLKFKIRHG